MVDYLIEKVFAEFQNNLSKLLEKHDEMINDLAKEIQKLKIEQINANWKIILTSSIAGAGGVKGIEKLLEIIK
jgi:predicted component of viral defense system (DUF524 family)